MRSRLRRGLAGAVSSQAQAYGFTITVWCSGAFLLDEHGTPRPADILAFAGGALGAMILAVMVGAGGPRSPLAASPQLRAHGAMHPLSVFAAILAGWGVAAALDGVCAFFAGAFVAVLVYQLAVAAEIASAVVED